MKTKLFAVNARPFLSQSNCEIYARSGLRSENGGVKVATSRIGALFNTDARSKRSTCPTPPQPRLFQSFQTFNRSRLPGGGQVAPFKSSQT